VATPINRMEIARVIFEREYNGPRPPAGHVHSTLSHTFDRGYSKPTIEHRRPSLRRSKAAGSGLPKVVWGVVLALFSDNKSAKW